MNGKKLRRGISGVALPLVFGVLLVILWQTQVLHMWMGTDTITLPLPTRIGEIISANFTTISGHIRITVIVALGGLVVGSVIGYAIALVATVFSKWGAGGLTIVSAFNAIPIVALAPVVNNWTRDMYTCSKERMEDKIKTFSKFGDAGHGGITRYSLSPEAIMARNEFVKRMKAIGAEIETDDVANMYATIPGSDPNAKRIVMASHCDSVKNGGNYDGILGVMSAMEVLETVVKENIPHKHPLTAMIWTNEEGSLYPPAMMCSGIVCYDYLPEDIRAKFKFEDMMQSKSILDSAKTFGEALEKSGFKGDRKFRLSPEKYQYMFETHIEQGPVLEDTGNEIGVVDCVLGMFNYRLKFYGQTTHAGTFPMPKRRDAFYAASQALCYLHEEIDKLGISDLVYTTGEVVCHPCVHTCVPDFFDFSFDSRHEDPKILEKVLAIVKSCADREWSGCKCEVVKAWNRDTVYWDKKLVSYVKAAAEELGVKHQYIHSGAGHDAQFAAYMLPTTMIFVQSKDGLSHCEPEFSSVEHCTAGASVMLNAVLKADND